LREDDLSPVNYKRVAEADGQEVPWTKIVKGYEYEKGKFIVLKEEDFKRVDIEATQTVDIIDFVKLEEVNPVFFYKPYYMEPEKGGDKAYVLLREALRKTGKIAIAKVVIKTRQHLAAVKPQERGLMLELMHFSNELIDVSEFKTPATKDVSSKELEMATALVESMSDEWQPDKYNDEYRDALHKLIEDKIENPDQPAGKSAKRPKSTNVIDLVSVLQKSLEQTSGKKGKASPNPAKTQEKMKGGGRKKAA
jgi:DNA end-binding protein Ku